MCGNQYLGREVSRVIDSTRSHCRDKVWVSLWSGGGVEGHYCGDSVSSIKDIISARHSDKPLFRHHICRKSDIISPHTLVESFSIVTVWTCVVTCVVTCDLWLVMTTTFSKRYFTCLLSRPGENDFRYTLCYTIKEVWYRTYWFTWIGCWNNTAECWPMQSEIIHVVSHTL